MKFIKGSGRLLCFGISSSRTLIFAEVQDLSLK